jgi:hypothetical protein
MIAAIARREILGMVVPPGAMENPIIFNMLCRDATRKYMPPMQPCEHGFAQTHSNPA